ncbi:MAG: hypothetical protein COA52_16310 [Hyphomicrobiales bacterium]|nr:TIGR02594 family protein [Hyphomicrobiales bacterium]PCJ85285.1 MAG: hypothetical protein COA52_16310 [Hyphomicrobiales bacterium]
MHKVIDCAWNIGEYAAQIKAGGVDTVIRYYNRSNSTKLPSKRLDKAEADALADAGLSIAVVYQQGGGSKGRIHELDAQSGKSDAKRALELANRLGQPEGSAIYFAVDHDYYRKSELDRIKPYFKAVSKALSGKYKVGVYGSGRVGKAMTDAGFADYIWLAAAKGWSGTRTMLKTDQWALYQIYPSETWGNKFSYDGNLVGGKWKNFGQFRLDQQDDNLGASPELCHVLSTHSEINEIIANGGLNLRRGPGENYAVESTLPAGTLVSVLQNEGGWSLVDINGDGSADGYMYASYLRAVSGGLPLPSTTGSSPYDIAKAELHAGVKEVAGPGNNPRISMYHKTTNKWAGTADSVAWCSSFVNYCVEQAGYTGTDRQNARSWENWSQDVTSNPHEGDIVVFSRKTNGTSGHVGFFVEDMGSWVKVLGGNQGNRVKYSNYPKDGKLGNTPYKVLSIRRP